MVTQSLLVGHCRKHTLYLSCLINDVNDDMVNTFSSAFSSPSTINHKPVCYPAQKSNRSVSRRRADRPRSRFFSKQFAMDGTGPVSYLRLKDRRNQKRTEGATVRLRSRQAYRYSYYRITRPIVGLFAKKFLLLRLLVAHSLYSNRLMDE
jgi:hypothetical protein